MIAAGIDIGGTKIAAQLFDAEWQLADQTRLPTPSDYPALIEAIAEAYDWIDSKAGAVVPIGIGAAGLVNPADGLALTANLSATGKPLVKDIEARAGRDLHLINDCRAMTLSEAVFGAARGSRVVAGLILGTGVGGGIAIDGRLVPSGRALGGEFGHMSAPADLIARHGLPINECGCGRRGCIETYISGPGLARIAQATAGVRLDPAEIAAARKNDRQIAGAWAIWLDLVAELILSLTYAVDPDTVVLGGGLSQIDGLCAELSAAVVARNMPRFGTPEILVAEGGDASGARGAAYHAFLQERSGD